MTVDEPEETPAAKAPKEKPVMPTAAEAAADARDAGERPALVRYAFVVWVVAGLFSVVNAVIMLVNKQRLIDTWTANKAPNITNEQIARGATTLLWMFLVAAVVFAVLFTLFAYKAQDGVRRARLLLTILCLVTVAFYFFVLPTAIGLMVALLTLIAAVLLYLPKSNGFFKPADLPT